jgi:hypothetical protein
MSAYSCENGSARVFSWERRRLGGHLAMNAGETPALPGKKADSFWCAPMSEKCVKISGN